jgi:hypothetical protein
MHRRSDASNAQTQARSLVMSVAMASSLGSSAVFAASSEFHVWPFTNHVWSFSTQSTEYDRNLDQPSLGASFKMPEFAEPSLAIRPRLTWRPNRETNLTVSLGRKASIQFRLTYSLLPWKAPPYAATNFLQPMHDSSSMLAAYPNHPVEEWGSAKKREPRYEMSLEKAHFRSYSGLLGGMPYLLPSSNRFTLAKHGPTSVYFGAVMSEQPRTFYTDRTNETFGTLPDSIITTRYDDACSLYEPDRQVACNSGLPDDSTFHSNALKALKSKPPDGLHASLQKEISNRLTANTRL